MNISYHENPAKLAEQAAETIIDELRQNPDLLLCAATGSSPAALYHALLEANHAKPSVFERLRLLKLDEWIGLPNGATGTCEAFLQEKLIQPLGISPDRYISFVSDTQNPDDECCRIQQFLNAEGPLDVCILGLGKNGHIGFNEPADELQADCHIARLSESSQHHAMVQQYDHKPNLGFTLGLRDILAARKIILIIAGSGKEEAKSSVLSGKVSTDCPASFLHLHPNVDCYILE